MMFVTLEFSFGPIRFAYLDQLQYIYPLDPAYGSSHYNAL